MSFDDISGSVPSSLDEFFEFEMISFDVFPYYVPYWAIEFLYLLRLLMCDLCFSFQQNSLEKMNLSKVISCHKQVVSGLMYHFVLEVEQGSQPKQYEAKVWVKPGGASKKLEEFKPKDA